jgi:hypothetical protein
MHIRRSAEGIAQLLRRGMQPGAAEGGNRGRIGFARGDGTQHPSRACAEQVGYQRGDFDVRFLEERLEAILELDTIPRQLILASGHRAPQPLRHIRHKAEGQLVRDQPFHEALGIREISFPAGPAVIRLRLREMQRPGGRSGVPPTPLRGLPVALQRVPHRAPVLRGRLHHDLFDLVLDQPLAQEAQLAGRRAELPPDKLPIPFDFHIRDDDREHRLVHVDSCDPIGHAHLHHGKSGERAVMVSLRVTGYRLTTPIDSLKRARSGSSNMTASLPPLSRSTSPLAPVLFSRTPRFSSAFAS